MLRSLKRYLIVGFPNISARSGLENPILFTSTAQARQARDAVRRATLAKRKRGFAYEYLRLLCVKTDIINKKIEFAKVWMRYIATFVRVKPLLYMKKDWD